MSLLVVCLFFCLLQISTGFREELLKKEQEMMNSDVDLSVNYYYDEDKIDRLNNLYRSSNYYFFFFIL